jgi:hypothetical protein
MEIRSLGYDMIGGMALGAYLGGLVVCAITLPLLSAGGIVYTVCKIAYHALKAYSLNRQSKQSDENRDKITLQFNQHQMARIESLEWFKVCCWGLIPGVGHVAMLNKINQVRVRPNHPTSSV